MWTHNEFHWKAVNRFGQKQHGKQLAKSREEIERNLLAKGYHQIRIQRNFSLPRAPKTDEITQILTQWALLLNAMIPLKQALNILQENCLNIQLYQWVSELNAGLSAGYALSSCLEKQSRYLTTQEIQLVKMGEQSGKLGVMLHNIAQARTQSDKLRKKVKKVLFYPVIVLGISLALSLGLLLCIVPQFAELYGNSDKPLPWLTEMLFGLSAFLREQADWLGFVVLQAVVFLHFFAKKWAFLTACKTHMLRHLPLFKQVTEQVRIIFFTQNITLMLQAHIRLDVALAAFLSERTDPILQQEVQQMLIRLQQGYKLADGLNPSVFHSQVVQMIAIGEQSGNLAQMCQHVSEMYQQKLDYHIDLLSQLLEPALMVVMGLIVGTILVGLYLPIFDMGALVE